MDIAVDILKSQVNSSKMATSGGNVGEGYDGARNMNPVEASAAPVTITRPKLAEMKDNRTETGKVFPENILETPPTARTKKL